MQPAPTSLFGTIRHLAISITTSHNNTFIVYILTPRYNVITNFYSKSPFVAFSFSVKVLVAIFHLSSIPTPNISPFYQEVSSLHPLQVGKTNLFRLTGASYLGRYLSRQRQAALANFRLRCAPLSFLRSVRDDSGCAECSWCHMGVQDEHHLIFECPSLRMVHLRGRFASLYQVNNLRSFFHQCPLRLSDFFKDLMMLCASGHESG